MKKRRQKQQLMKGMNEQPPSSALFSLHPIKMKGRGNPALLFGSSSPMDQSQALFRPTHVAVDKSQKQLHINWNDGHESNYSFEQLRAACPCAECKAHQADDNPLRQALIVSTGLESAQLIGNYAIQFLWDDGHRFGIFTWEYLRSLG
jgi:DUF971 family protein